MAVTARSFLNKIRPYKPGKPIEEVIRELGLKGDVIKLASNENPLGVSKLALVAMRKAIREMQLYPDDNCYYFRKKLAEYHGLGVGNFFVGNGSVEILPTITTAYLGPGNSAVVSKGAFIWYKIAVNISDGELIEVPLKDYRHNLEEMLGAIKENTKLIFIDNPINPTGTAVMKDELDAFMDKVPDNILVVIDEAYKEYINDPNYPDSMKYFNEGKNVIILRTFSKIYGLAGIRLGYGISKEEVTASLIKLRVSFNVNRLAQYAGIAALDDEEHIKRGVEVNEEGKQFLYNAYGKLGLFYLPTYANFIFVDFPRDSKLIFEELQRRGIITRTIKEYDFPNALRITIGTDKQNRRLIKELEQIL